MDEDIRKNSQNGIGIISVYFGAERSSCLVDEEETLAEIFVENGNSDEYLGGLDSVLRKFNGRISYILIVIRGDSLSQGVRHGGDISALLGTHGKGGRVLICQEGLPICFCERVCF